MNRKSIAGTTIFLVSAMCVIAQTFELLPPEQTGVRFQNEIVETEAFNILTDFYAYNGGGVGVGDFDRDGLLDIVFSSTQRGLTFYKNLGSLKFSDVTKGAGLELLDAGISTGVLVADLSGDGFPDIYLSRRYQTNIFYLNNRDGTFSNKTKEFGLDVKGSTTHALVLDYDRDGDLDLFVINNGEPRRKGHLNPGQSDQLFRNNGNGTFTDVSAQAGISDVGYGLSAVVGDVNNDGWPDIFVANDFEGRDILWVNLGNGTFENQTTMAFRNMSWSSMGSDMADLNGDGLLDIVSVDMLPRDHRRRMTQLGGMSIYGPFFDSAQRVHNALHLNRGNGRFSNVCYSSGIAATDWSWSVLAGDFNNDGMVDLYITNGTKRDMGDQDYVNNLYSGNDAIHPSAYRSMPSSKLANYLFQNVGGFSFKDVASEQGIGQAAVSNGAAMADLDNDGDLELIVNNTDDVAFVYRNLTNDAANSLHHWLGVIFNGQPGNRDAIGARCIVYAKNNVFVREAAASKGFHSTSDHRVHVGLGSNNTVDSMRVIWPDGLTSIHRELKIDAYQTIAYSPTLPRWVPSIAQPTLLKELARNLVPFLHIENSFDDFKRERLLPYRFSREGPGVVVGDINGDKREDIIFTGAKYQPSQAFIQNADGTFSPWICGIEDVPEAEDVDLALIDVDGDKDLDLIIVAGGNEFDLEDNELRDRLYKNDGKGHFTLVPNGLPGGLHSGSSIATADFDADGDIDVFIGGRVVPGRFSETPRSFLYRNEKGVFKDVTESLAPGLSYAGMTTDALWADVDGDGDKDLVVVGEWMSPQIWINTKGKFVEKGQVMGLSNLEGWWTTVEAADIDGDGDMDIILGNTGNNCRFVPEPDKPLICYISDIDDNGSLDPIVTYDVNGVRMPTRGKTTITQHIPSLSQKFNLFEQYAVATIDDVFPDSLRATAKVLVTRTFNSGILRNTKGRFAFEPFPAIAQISPIHAIATWDVDGDGDLDIILAGNSRTADGDVIAFDSGIGVVLLNNGKGAFSECSASVSGFSVPGDARQFAILSGVSSSPILVVAQNGRPPRFFELPVTGGN